MIQLNANGGDVNHIASFSAVTSPQSNQNTIGSSEKYAGPQEGKLFSYKTHIFNKFWSVLPDPFRNVALWKQAEPRSSCNIGTILITVYRCENARSIKAECVCVVLQRLNDSSNLGKETEKYTFSPLPLAEVNQLVIKRDRQSEMDEFESVCLRDFWWYRQGGQGSSESTKRGLWVKDKTISVH